ncbi:MAG: sensor histidine kinase [Halobacteriales archaeon]
MTELDAFHEFIVRLIGVRRRSDLLRASTEVLVDLIATDHCAIVGTEDGQTVLLAAAGCLPSGPGHPVTIVDRFVGGVELVNRSHVLDDITDVRSGATAEPSSTVRQPRSVLLVPVEGVGLIVASDPNPGRFAETDKLWAEQLGAFLERVVEADVPIDADDDRLASVGRTLARDASTPLSVARRSIRSTDASDDRIETDRITAALDRLEEVIASVEFVARLDDPAGGHDEVELGRVAREAWGPRSTARATLAVESDGSIHADREGLRLVLGNLFEHCVARSGAGVTVRVGTAGGGLFVADDGPPPAATQLEAIADAASSRPRTQGERGLAMARHLVDALGWSIDVVAVDAGGTRFDICDLDP